MDPLCKEHQVIRHTLYGKLVKSVIGIIYRLCKGNQLLIVAVNVNLNQNEDVDHDLKM